MIFFFSLLLCGLNSCPQSKKKTLFILGLENMMLLFLVQSFYWPDKESPQDLSGLSESELIFLTVIVIIWEKVTIA